uniref:Uncharacterized protein n=1 Tax=Anguilla anguilla TaxID=7936 RepID=A0A0E9S9A6_ANGAN
MSAFKKALSRNSPVQLEHLVFTHELVSWCEWVTRGLNLFSVSRVHPGFCV